MSNETVIQRAQQSLLGNYKQQPIALVRGEGCQVWDSDGKRYLDLIGGIATCALGHCHPEVVRAASAQLNSLWHVSNAFYSEPQVALAERLTAASGLPGARAFFCNSGGEANEALLKLARRTQKMWGYHQRSEVLTFDASFHGRTLATLTATGQAKYQQGFEPLPEGFRTIPYGDVRAVAHAIGPNTGAVLVEVVQGEGGVRVAPPGFLQGLRALCDEHRLLLLVDEVQTGIGRTGRAFGFQHEGVLPDAFSLAKALGNGLPIGAMVCSGAVAAALPPGTHGSTFGGNPVAAAAACATFDIACAQTTLTETARKGNLLLSVAKEIQSRHPQRIREVRGRGLLVGIDVGPSAIEVVGRCRESGVLVNLAGEHTVRFAPPLIVTDAQLIDGLSVFEKSLSQS